MVRQGQYNLYIQAAIAIGALFVALLAIWGDSIKSWFLGPRLKVVVRLKPPYCNRSINGTWFRIEVKNKSSTVARDVELWIVELARVVGPDGVPMDLVPPPLTWTHSSKATAPSINPSFTRYCDLGYLDESNPPPVPPDFYLSTEIQPNDRSTRLGPASYRMRIAVTASNAKVRYFVMRFEVPNYIPPTEGSALEAVNLRLDDNGSE